MPAPPELGAVGILEALESWILRERTCSSCHGYDALAPDDGREFTSRALDTSESPRGAGLGFVDEHVIPGRDVPTCRLPAILDPDAKRVAGRSVLQLWPVNREPVSHFDR